MEITRIQIPQSNYSTNHGANRLNKIVLHWVVGEISACDATFQNPTRQASAHYCVGSNGEVHQYVEDKDIAWHAGPGVNFESIGIEHAGGQMLPDGTRKKPTQVCHDTSAELVAMKCKQYNILCDREHIRKHSEYMNTSCPGTLDIDYIIAKANSILNGTSMTLNFEIIIQGVNLHVKILEGSFNGTATVKNLTAGTNWTVNINRKAGEVSGIVCENFGKALYEVSMGGVTKQLDLRDAPPVDPKDQEIADLKSKLETSMTNIKKLEAEKKMLQDQLAQQKEKYELELQEMKVTHMQEILDKDTIILQLREIAGVGILERFFKWVASIGRK